MYNIIKINFNVTVSTWYVKLTITQTESTYDCIKMSENIRLRVCVLTLLQEEIPPQKAKTPKKAKTPSKNLITGQKDLATDPRTPLGIRLHLTSTTVNFLLVVVFSKKYFHGPLLFYFANDIFDLWLLRCILLKG